MRTMGLKDDHMPGCRESRHAWAWLSALLLSLPGVAAGQAWQVEEVGIPIHAVVYGNSGGALAAGPGGEGTMFYTSYYCTTGAELVGCDFRRGTVLRRPLPSQGGYGITVDGDGCVYVGGVSPGDLYRYDPAADALSTIQVARFGVQFIWDVAPGIDGTIYAAAGHPRSALVAYDPVSGEVRDLGDMVPGQQYLRSLCVDRKGRVWCGIGTAAHLVVFDPATGERRAVLPPAYARSSFVYDLEAVGDHVAASILFDGVLLIYDIEKLEVVHTIPRPPGEKCWMTAAGGGPGRACLWTMPSGDVYRLDLSDGSTTRLVERLGHVKVVEQDRWLHAMDDQSYVVYDLIAGREVMRKVLASGGEGMDIFALTAGPDGNIYGSTYINMHIFRCEAGTKKLTDLGRVSRWSGQVDSLSLGVDGRIYMGAYTDAVVSIYDPRQPWRPGREPQANPRELGPIGHGQYRTRANCLGPDGRIYVGSIPAYGSGSTGALTICDPQTGAMEVRTDIVPGGAVEALVCDDLYVYGAGGGEFFVYDPIRREKRFHESRVTTSLARGPEGTVIGSGGGKLFLYDRQANRIVEEFPNPGDDFTHMTGHEGVVYAINGRHLARIRVRPWAVDILIHEGGKHIAVDGAGRVYFARGPKLLRCAPQPATSSAASGE